MKQLECLRCGHLWWTRTPNLPRACPHCKSPVWNQPRRTFVVNHLDGDPGNNAIENLQVVDLREHVGKEGAPVPSHRPTNKR